MSSPQPRAAPLGGSHSGLGAACPSPASPCSLPNTALMRTSWSAAHTASELRATAGEGGGEEEKEEEGTGPGLSADRQRSTGQTHSAGEVSPLNPEPVAWSLLSPKLLLSNALCSLFCSNSNFLGGLMAFGVQDGAAAVCMLWRIVCLHSTEISKVMSCRKAELHLRWCGKARDGATWWGWGQGDGNGHPFGFRVLTLQLLAPFANKVTFLGHGIAPQY